MNRSTLVSRFVYRFLLPTILLPASIVLAGTETYDAKSTPPPLSQACETPSPLEVRIGIPGWITGISGDFGVRGIVSPLDVKFSDILKRLDQVPIVLSAYVRYNRWEFFGDGQYLSLSDSVTLPGVLFDRADIEVKSGLVEAFVGYRLINCEKGSLSLFAGGRYNYMSGDLQIFDNGDPRFPALRQRLGIPLNLRVSGSKEWVDPVIGIGGKMKVAKAVSVYAKGDIGGFGAASDFTWQVQGGLEFQVTRSLYSDVGWRYMKYDYTSGGFTNKTELNGPYIETGLKF
jgi:opacity protein-like surface antigen